jgi:hypothetical protein
MPTDNQTPEIVAAEKVRIALGDLRADYAGQHNAAMVGLLDEMAGLPMEDLSRLHDLIVDNATAAQAILALKAA